jgi:mRNA-degrading endonuclease YafQ of YafQ-DinJ toxin-antitoxin module
MALAAIWELVEEALFKRRRKKYRHDHVVRKSLQSVLESLQGAEAPDRLGEPKKDRRFNETYVTRLTKSLRLQYSVDLDTQKIRLLNMGDHKEVYGRD